MTRNTLNHCLKFALRSIFCHICYRKISEKNFNTPIKLKLLVSKMSDSCCQGFDWFDWLRLIFSSRTHRISIRLHMQDHNIPLSLFIISVYILTVLVLWNIFSKGHVTVTSCLFLQHDPSILPKKSLKGRKSTNESLQIRDFLPFSNFQNGVF